jgi:hypothetical protein
VRFAGLLAASLLFGAPQPPPGISRIEARQFIQSTGTFSDNLLTNGSTYLGWNTHLRGDNYGRGSGDILVVVRVANPSERFVSFETPLTITAVAGGKVIARRRYQNISLDRGTSFAAPLWLQDASCIGRTVVTARLDGRTASATLNMECGE